MLAALPSSTAASSAAAPASWARAGRFQRELEHACSHSHALGCSRSQL